MSWHFSRALVEVYSAGTCSDGEPSVPSSGNPTPQLYLPSDRMTAFSRLSRFGMTFGVLPSETIKFVVSSAAFARSAGILSSRGASPARTSAPQAEGLGSTGSGRGSGAKWRESLAKYDPDSRSWRTAQFSLLGDLESFSETWPRWGMTVGGEFYPQPTPGRPTLENESGFWPTARTRGMLGGSGSREMMQTLVQSGALEEAEAVRMLGVKLWPTPLSTDATHGGPNQRDSSGRPGLSGMVHNWPTPKANDAEKRGDFDETNPRNGLPAAVKAWPTPQARDHFPPHSPEYIAEKKRQGHGMSNLNDVVAGGKSTPPTYPTPTKSDGSGGPGTSGRQGGENLRTNIGGQLNPEWVEWLMGWPLGWTDLKPLEMGRFQRWLDSHGKR